MEFKPEEAAFLASKGRCEACGHLEALHNDHCCTFCAVPDCRCRWGVLEESEVVP